MFVSIGTLFVGIVVGLYICPIIANFFNFDKKSYDKAIRDRFSCKNNDFTYFHTGEDDFYMVTVNDQEYEVKFSDNKPRKIIYCGKLEKIEDNV